MSLSFKLGKLKETDELSKKEYAFPKAILLSYNNDILQSRREINQGKYHDIILDMVLPDSIVNFKANPVKVCFFQNTNAYSNY